jgi:hypothetical protein
LRYNGKLTNIFFLAGVLNEPLIKNVQPIEKIKPESSSTFYFRLVTSDPTGARNQGPYIKSELLSRIKEMNGKETTQGSFLKYTAHEFKKLLRRQSENKIHLYQVDVPNKRYEFWQRDPLAIHLYTKAIALQN